MPSVITQGVAGSSPVRHPSFRFAERAAYRAVRLVRHAWSVRGHAGTMLIMAVIMAAILLATAPAAAQDVGFDAIDRHVATVAIPPNVDVPRLTQLLVKPTNSEIQKVRAIAWWIASNVRYDHQAHERGVAQQNAGQAPVWVLDLAKPDVVLQSRKATCMGYAELFVACCKSINVEAKHLSGNTRYSDEGHAWNAVRIGGRWQLVDVSSMASGAGNNQKGPIQPVDFYFLPKPEHFIFSHRPNEDEWQLLEKPISKTDFYAVPVVLPPLFRLGVTPQRLRKAAREGVREFVQAAYVAKDAITLLEAPLARRLEPGTGYRFRIRAAGYAAVHVDDGRVSRELAKKGDDFDETVTPRGPFLRIGVQAQRGGKIDGLMQYVVGIDSLGPDIAALINKARRQAGAGELVHDAELDATALAHAHTMAQSRGTPGRAGCLVAATDNPKGKPPTEFVQLLVDSMLEEQRQKAWAMVPAHARVGAGAVTAGGRTYFCIEFR